MKPLEYVIILVLISSCFGENPTNIEDPKMKMNKIWQIETHNIEVPSAQPIIIGDSLLIFTGELSLRAVRTLNGETKWRGEIDDENALNTKVMLFEGGRIISAHKNSVLGWDYETGGLSLKINKQDQISVFPRGRNTIVNGGFAFIGDTLDAYLINSNGDLRFAIDVEFGSLSLGYENLKVFLGQTNTITGALTRGKIRAFDSQSGEGLWVYETDNGGFEESPFIENGVLYAGAIGNSPVNEVVALHAETGELIWRQTDYVWTQTMSMSDKYLYINTGVSLAALNKIDGSIAWRYEWTSFSGAEPVYLEGYVYHTDHNQLFVIDDSNGKLVHSEPVPQGGFYFWHVAASSDKIFAQTSRQLIAYQPWHLRGQ